MPVMNLVNASAIFTVLALVSPCLTAVAAQAAEATAPQQTIQMDSAPALPGNAGPVAENQPPAPEAVQGIPPEPPRHAVLLAALADRLSAMQAIADAGGWPSLPDDLRLEPGDDTPAVAILRQRLTISGEYGGPAATGAATAEPSAATEPPTATILPLGATASPDTHSETYYDEALANAVRRFQENHGLEIDAIVGRQTVATLNVSAARRVAQMRVNMARLADLPTDLGQRHIIVNVPGFEAFLFDGDTLALRSRIIVGKDQQQTPQFTGLVTQVVVNPFWNVPDSIARNEILPKLVKDPDYLAKEDMEVLEGWQANTQSLDPMTIDWAALLAEGRMPYHFRQRPGPRNALGQVKILFPNEHAVYLHDTPSRGLFNRRVRAFSHGCMRVDKIVELATAVLGQDWTTDRLQNLIDRSESKTIRVSLKMPVHVIYLTSWVDPETGVLQFRNDLYDRDDKALRTLAAEDIRHSQQSANLTEAETPSAR